MSQVSAGLTLHFAPDSSTDESVFQLEVMDNGGKKPVHLRPRFVLHWSWANGLSGIWKATDLTMLSFGKRRVRLYANNLSPLDISLHITGGEAEYIGERTAPRRESFSWNDSKTNRLAYWYSAAEARIIHTTSFFNGDGDEVNPPVLNTQTGMIAHSEKVIGSLIVEYEPSFYLYEITYDGGVEGDSPETLERKTEMLTAWLAGNINDADIPPVGIIALAPGRATQGSFQREFWPAGADSHEGYKEEQTTTTTYTPPEEEEPPEDPDPCWEACWRHIGSPWPLSPWDHDAIQSCMENRGERPDIFYKESSRENLTVRVYAKDEQGADIENEYIEVKRPLKVTFTLQKSGGSESVCNGTPENDPDLSESIEFRFDVSDLRYLGETYGGEKIYRA